MKVVTLLAIFFIAGNGMAATEHNSIIYLRPTDAINLNPWQAEDTYSNEIAANMFEGLVRFKKNATAIEPCLATSWSVADHGRRWRFVLRRGITFHDNTPFNAQAVLYSFRSRMGKQQKLYQRPSFLFSFVTDIRSSDPYSVEIVLERPYAPFLIALADSAAFIQSPTAGKASPYVPVGTGPFRFSSWSKGRSLILTRNQRYWARRGSVEKIIFKVMPDSLGTAAADQERQRRHDGHPVGKRIRGIVTPQRDQYFKQPVHIHPLPGLQHQKETLRPQGDPRRLPAYHQQ